MIADVGQHRSVEGNLCLFRWNRQAGDRHPQGRAEQQRQTLKGLHDFAGFPAADNRALISVARLTHKLELDSARSAQWINEAARQARLARIDSEYAEQLRALQAE